MDAIYKMMILAVGGALGTNARYWLALWLNEASWRPQGTWLSSFPLGTFVINVTGSFVLGLVGTVFLERLSPDYRDWFLLLGTGFCGGYTTFSTFEWETLQLLRNGSWMLAAVNVVGSVVVGFLGVVLGAAFGNLIFPRR
ncbi:MAG: fluoride efflux transporter CrcB [Thermoguttaceae bacterium]